MGHSVVDPKHASIECGLNFPQPTLKRYCLAWIAGTGEFDAHSDLAKNERARLSDVAFIKSGL
jgi:hypothetical protein